MRIWIGLFVILATSCGNDHTFTGSSGVNENKAAPPPPPSDAEILPEDKLPDDKILGSRYELALSCLSDRESNSSSVTLEEDLLAPVSDGYTHELWISSDLCQKKDVTRQVAIIVDASGSMQANDPRTGDQCGRLRAVEALIQSGGPQRSYALITFADTVIFSNRQFYDNLSQIKADMTSFGGSADILCDAQTTTHYDAALDRARDLFERTEPADFREIYFVSDGAPSEGHAGLAIADELKSEQGITLVAIMLGSRDRILEDQLASRDRRQQPYFERVDQAGKLTKTLADLAARAENRVVKADVFIKGLTNGMTLSFSGFDYPKGQGFALPPITLDQKKEPLGYEVRYQYRLSDDTEYIQTKTYRWP